MVVQKNGSIQRQPVQYNISLYRIVLFFYFIFTIPITFISNWVAVLFASLYVLYLFVRSFSSGNQAHRTIEQMKSGEYWVHWSYDTEEWRQIAPREWFGATMRYYSLAPVVVSSLRSAAATAVIGFIALWVTYGSSQSAMIAAFSQASVLIPLIMGATFITGYFHYQQMQNVLAQNDTIEVYIGALGIHFTDLPDNVFYFVGGRGRYTFGLANVEMTPGDPAHLTFTLRSSRGKYHHRFRMASVPIPRGREDKATELAARLRDAFVPQEEGT